MLWVLKYKVPSNIKAIILNTLVTSNMTKCWYSSSKNVSDFMSGNNNTRMHESAQEINRSSSKQINDSMRDKSRKKAKVNPINRNVQKTRLSSADIEMCKNALGSSCNRGETTCRMPSDEIDEDRGGSELHTTKTNKMPKRDTWIPLDYIHRMDEKKSLPRTYDQTWKECPRIVIKKSICTTEDVECPKNPNEKPKFVKHQRDEPLNRKSLVDVKMCNNEENIKNQPK